MYIYINIPICESEVISWILSVPLDYVLVEIVDGCAVVNDATCVSFDRTSAVGGLEPKGHWIRSPWLLVD